MCFKVYKIANGREQKYSFCVSMQFYQNTYSRDKFLVIILVGRNQSNQTVVILREHNEKNTNGKKNITCTFGLQKRVH